VFQSAQKDSRTSDFDGLLTMGLFRRVFICHKDHFAVLDPLQYRLRAAHFRQEAFRSVSEFYRSLFRVPRESWAIRK
jgi:hypothetical protein